MGDFWASGIGQTVIQLIGFGAVGAAILAWQERRHCNIMYLQALSCIIWAVQFVLLGSITAVLLNVLGAMRNLVYSQKMRFKCLSSPTIPIIFAVLFLGAGIFSFTLEGWKALLPTFSMIVASVSFYVSDEKIVRRLSFLISPPWLIYNIIFFSLAGIFNEVLCMASIAIAIYRYDIKNERVD